jgi:TolB protein
MKLFHLVLVIALVSCDGDGPNNDPPALRNKIVFLSDRDGFSQLYVMNTDGSGVRLIPVTATIGAINMPAISPSGEQIAFQVNGDIWTMNADGSDQVNLTNHPAQDAFPAWSPDGTRITFASDRDGNYEIYVMDANGSNPVNLTNNPADESGSAWSPSGGLIAFDTGRDGNLEVYVMNSDGSNPVNLTNDPGGDYGPTWSNAGTRLAFGSTRNGTNGLFIMGSVGSGVVPISTPGMNAGFPDWSPGDTLIAFGGNAEVQVIRPDGTGLRNLTQNGAQDHMPSWSPSR